MSTMSMSMGVGMSSTSWFPLIGLCCSPWSGRLWFLLLILSLARLLLLLLPCLGLGCGSLALWLGFLLIRCSGGSGGSLNFDSLLWLLPTSSTLRILISWLNFLFLNIFLFIRIFRIHIHIILSFAISSWYLTLFILNNLHFLFSLFSNLLLYLLLAYLYICLYFILCWRCCVYCCCCWLYYLLFCLLFYCLLFGLLFCWLLLLLLGCLLFLGLLFGLWYWCWCLFGWLLDDRLDYYFGLLFRLAELYLLIIQTNNSYLILSQTTQIQSTAILINSWYTVDIIRVAEEIIHNLTSFRVYLNTTCIFHVGDCQKHT